jgi:hypothetical protein
LAASAPALAQNDDASRGAAPPPARVGNIYDHKAHQPTESDVPAAAAGNKQQVEKEVQDLLRQTDDLDKQSEHQEQLAPDALRSGR